ncbi:hypothetical protein N9A25_00415 [bacterium]|nr:hypothetical protein [bacterium]
MTNKKTYGYNYSWSQPYKVTYTNQEIANGLINKYNLNSVDDVVNWIDQQLHQFSIEEELELLTYTDNLVSAMDTYPDAERIISKAMGRED